MPPSASSTSPVRTKLTVHPPHPAPVNQPPTAPALHATFTKSSNSSHGTSQLYQPLSLPTDLSISWRTQVLRAPCSLAPLPRHRVGRSDAAVVGRIDIDRSEAVGVGRETGKSISRSLDDATEGGRPICDRPPTLATSGTAHETRRREGGYKEPGLRFLAHRLP